MHIRYLHEVPPPPPPEIEPLAIDEDLTGRDAWVDRSQPPC